MNRSIRTLAEMLSERKYFDMQEMENLIEIHFKLWLYDEETTGSNIIKKRNSLFNEQEQIKIQKYAIEKQLDIAKAEKKEGLHVDEKWIARAKFASRIKGAQIISIQNQLSNLKTEEKRINIEKHLEKDTVEFDKLKKYVSDLIGKDKFIELMHSFRK